MFFKRIFFIFIPPSLKPINQWQELLKDLSLPGETLTHLIEAGFMPIDMKSTLTDNICINMLYKNYLQEDPQHPHFCLDPYYGAIIFNKDNRISNLGISFLFNSLRYLKKVNPNYAPNEQGFITMYNGGKNIITFKDIMYGSIRQKPSLYYSIGAMRGQKAFLNLENNNEKLLYYEVQNRLQLNKVLNRLNKYTEQNPEYEIWYRGQPNDYLLPDLRNYAQSMICPWRSELDTSLVPSLYRLLLKLLPNMKEYLRTCFELALISRFIESYFPDTQFSSSVNFILDNNLYEKFLLNQPPDERWDYHVFYQNLQRYFFLQHYGIPSPALDITQDPKVALFFAQNSLQEDQYVPVDFNTSKPILYIFLLDKELDLFINSKEMSEYHRLLRPLRQKCGLITGATFITRNDYSHLLALKIRIEKPIINRNFTAEYLLPSPNEDQFLYSLSDYCDKLNLTRIRPFVLQEN